MIKANLSVMEIMIEVTFLIQLFKYPTLFGILAYAILLSLKNMPIQFLYEESHVCPNSSLIEKTSSLILSFSKINLWRLL